MVNNKNLFDYRCWINNAGEYIANAKNFPPVVKVVASLQNFDCRLCEEVISTNVKKNPQYGLLITAIYDKDWIVDTAKKYNNELSDDTIMEALLTIREFIEWEYNGGKGDFQPNTTTRTWNNLPVDAKIGYVACSVYGDIVGKSKLFLKTDNKTYLLHNAQNDVKKLEAIDEYLNEVYRKAEHSFKSKTGTSFNQTSLNVRLDAIAQYIEDNFDKCIEAAKCAIHISEI